MWLFTVMNRNISPSILADYFKYFNKRWSDKVNSFFFFKEKILMIALLRYNSDAICFTILNCTIWLFSVYLQCCTSIPTIYFQNIFTPERNPVPFSSHTPFPSTPSPWQPLTFLSLWIWGFWTFHIYRII